MGRQSPITEIVLSVTNPSQQARLPLRLSILAYQDLWLDWGLSFGRRSHVRPPPSDIRVKTSQPWDWSDFSAFNRLQGVVAVMTVHSVSMIAFLPSNNVFVPPPYSKGRQLQKKALLDDPAVPESRAAV